MNNEKRILENGCPMFTVHFSLLIINFKSCSISSFCPFKDRCRISNMCKSACPVL